MSEFIWQSSDGDYNNPVSWGIALDGTAPTGPSAATTQADPTVDLTDDTPDLAAVSVGDTLRLVGRIDGKNSGEYFEITAIEDAGADTLEVSPTPASTVASGIVWVIYGALPGANAATDDIKFPANSIVGLTKGLDQSGQGKFTSIIVHPSFGGEFASLSNPFIASADEVLYEGIKGFHYKDGGNETDLLTINARSLTKCTLQGNAGGAKITEVRIAAGQVDALSLDATTVYISQVDGATTLVNWDLSAGTITNLYINRGEFVSGVAVTLMYFAGGIFTTTAPNTGAIAKLHMFGGHLIHNSNGIIVGAFILGGFLDFSQDERSKTIQVLRVWPGAKAAIPDWVTVTNGGHIYDELIVGA